MKYLFSCFTLFALCMAATSYAQVEKWDTYMVRMGRMPSSVMVDMGLISTAPDKRFPYLVVTGPKTTHCDTHGLPDADEIAVLEGILDATSSFLTGVTPKILAGTVTRNCQRLNYYYVKDTSNVRNALGRMYSRNFKNTAYVISIKQDPAWITYRTFLYPDDTMRQWMDNEKIMVAMLQHGDSLTKPRDIRFTFSFATDSIRGTFINFAKKKGYKTDTTTSNTPGAAYGAFIATYNKVKMETITPLINELCGEASKEGGIYNGWTAPMTRKQ